MNIGFVETSYLGQEYELIYRDTGPRQLACDKARVPLLYVGNRFNLEVAQSVLSLACRSIIQLHMPDELSILPAAQRVLFKDLLRVMHLEDGGRQYSVATMEPAMVHTICDEFDGGSLAGYRSCVLPDMGAADSFKEEMFDSGEVKVLSLPACSAEAATDPEQYRALGAALVSIDRFIYGHQYRRHEPPVFPCLP